MKKTILMMMVAMAVVVVGSFSVLAVELPHPQGKVVGPIDDKSGSSYYLYLPESLPEERDVPLLFYTNAGGGDDKLLERITDGAERVGWILAMSVQSKNGLFVTDCVKYSKNSIKHILKTLPVNDDRIYFTGNSGGGAQAFRNADYLDGCGVMPNVAYVPSDLATPSCDCFIMNGGCDFNRYPSAHARKRIGKRATHRFYEGSHVNAPDWLMVEGMIWLEGRYLEKKRGRVPEEQQFYEKSVIRWIEELRETEPYRAYYWARFLQDELELSRENRSIVEELVQALGKDNTNRLYVEGLTAMDELSLKKISKFGSGSLHNHCDKSVVAACDELLRKYKEVPLVGEALESIRRPTN